MNTRVSRQVMAWRKKSHKQDVKNTDYNCTYLNSLVKENNKMCAATLLASRHEVKSSGKIYNYGTEEHLFSPHI